MNAGLEAPSGKDAADLARVIAGVPITIELHLNLVRHGFRPGLVAVGKGSAEGSQLRVGAKRAGLVELSALFRAAMGELDELARLHHGLMRLVFPLDILPRPV